MRAQLADHPAKVITKMHTFLAKQQQQLVHQLGCSESPPSIAV
jgi:hypothetical protein